MPTTAPTRHPIPIEPSAQPTSAPIATAASDPHLALAAALTYALAYTFELGLSLLAYFGRIA